MSEVTEIASMGITTMIELMQARDEIKRLKEALAKQEGQSNFCPNCEALSRELKAIKQEQGEPVAYVVTTEVHGQMCSFIHRSDLTELLPDGQLLYTTPQPAPQGEARGLSQQKPLTDEQIEEIFGIHNDEDERYALHYERDLVRQIEAAHGIKE